MATWEEILNQSYNPVNSVRDRHQALMEKRQAENIARMRAANPGFQVGGNMPAMQQGFQQFAPPNISGGQDDWLKTQFEMANEHLGGFGVQQQPAAQDPTGGMGGMGNPNGPNGSGEGPQSNGGRSFGGVNFGDMPDPLASAIGNAQGLTPGQAQALSFMAGPLFSPLIEGITMSPETESALSELSSMLESGTIPDMNKLQETKLFDEPEISKIIDAAPGVGLGGASDNSGFGGGGGTSISEGNQGAMGNTGPGNDGTGGQTSGGNNSSGGGGGGDGGGGGGTGGGTGGDGPNGER